MADSLSAPGSSAGPATDVAPVVAAPPVATVTAAPTPAPSPAPAPAPQPVQPFPDDDIITQAVDSQRLALTESLRQANASNPDKAAAIVKLAAQTRLHPTTASDIEGDLQATVAVQNADVDGLMQHHPELAGWLLDRSNAQVSHDDLPSLRALDLMVRQATRSPDEDPLGILPKGYRFAGGRIVRPQGDNNEVIGDYRGLSEDLQARQNRDEREAVESSDRALRVGNLADPFTTGVLGAFGGTLKAAKFLAGTSSANVSQSLDEITLASVEQHPGLGADAMRLAGGLVGDLPLLLSGGEVLRGVTALTDLGQAGNQVAALARARTARAGGFTSGDVAALEAERAAANSTLSAAQAAGQFAGLNRILEPLLGKAGAEKAGERLLTAGAMAPVAAKIGLASAADKGPGYGAVDALINLAIPSAFGRVGVQRFLTPGLDQVGGNASVSAAGFLLKQAGLDATQNQAIELATAIHEHAAGDEHALDFDRLAPRLGMAGAAGGLMGGLFNLPEASRIKAARQGMQIRQSQAEADGLSAALDAALASKTVQRSPDQAKQLVAEVIRSTGGSGDTVYAQGEAFRDHFTERGEDPAKAAESMGVDPNTYAAAMASNSPLPIPLEGFLTRAREDDKPLLDHMTLRPDALTREQAGTATEALRKDIESQVAAAGKKAEPTDGAAKDTVALDESSNRVGDVVEEQLLAAGTKPDTAKYQSLVWAKGMRQLAERWNQGAAERGAKPMTPEDIFNRYQVKVSGPDAMRPEDIANQFSHDGSTFMDEAHAPIAHEHDILDEMARLGGVSKKGGATGGEHDNGLAIPPAHRVKIAGHMAPDVMARELHDQGFGDGTTNTMWKLVQQDSRARLNAREYRQDGVATQIAPRGTSLEFGEMRRQWRKAHGERAVDTTSKEWNDLVQQSARVDAKSGKVYFQPPKEGEDRAKISIGKDKSISIQMLAKADRSSFLHETGHAYLEILTDLAAHPEAPLSLRGDLATIHRWLRGDGALGVAVDAKPHGAELGAKEIGDFLVRHSGGAEGHSPLSAEPLLHVFGKVIRATADPKVLRSVVGSLPVDVVNLFRAKKLAPEDALHDVAVLKSVFAVDSDGAVSISVDAAKGLLSLVKAVAAARAEASAVSNARGGEVANGAAARAGDVGHAGDFERLSDEWKALSDKDREDRHEKFARGFERWLMEGKAPSIGLRRAFAAFARWLTSIYRDLVNLKVDLSPEVRRVFDKLLASDAEIAAASAELHADPFFTDAKAAGMSPAEFARYQRDTAESKIRAADSTRAELMSFEKADARAERERAEHDLTKAITADVNGRQDMLAIGALQNGEIPPGLRVPDGVKLKLDRAELVDRYGEDALKDLPGPAYADDDGVNAGRRLYAREGGMGIDEAAILFGYKDGDDLMTALVTAPDREALIATRVAKEMSALYPDPIHDADLASTAAAHLADELAGDVVGAEVRALEKQAGAPPTPRELIRQAAEKTVQGMRAYTLKPEVYRRAAEQASIKQFAKQVQLHEAKTPEQRAKVAAEVLAIAKERLTNLELFAAARRAKDASERNEAWIRQHDTLDARERMGKAGGWEFTCYNAMGDVAATVKTEREGLFYIKENPGSTFERTSSYLDQWDNIQEGFSLKRASNKALRRRESLRQFISRNTEDGEPVNIPDQVVEDLGKRRWTELTVAEQGAVNDGLRNVYSMALWKNKLLANKRKADLETVATEVAAGIAQHATGTVAARVGTVGLEKAQNGVGGFLASATKDSFVARQMDGYQDGGVVWDTFILPRSEAATAKSIRQAEAAEIRAAALKAWDKSAGVTREAIPGTHLRLSREQRIGMAVYWGSREGRQRILADLDRQETPGTEGDVRAVLDSLDAADIALVEATWKQMGSYRPEIASLERRTTGMEPEWIQAVPFRIGDHTLPGGYCPIKYDITQGAKATNIDALTDAKSALRAANLAATTRRGFTKQRADQVQGRGLRYDFGVVAEGLNEVVHDLTHREMLQDQNRLFRNTTIAESIVKHYGKRTLDQLVNTTADIAQGEAPAKSAAERFARQLRKGVSAAAFGFNLTSALANVTGVTQAIPRVGVPRLLQALGHVTGSVGRTESAIAEMERRSPEMAMRGRTFMREVAEANATTGAKGTLDKIQRIGYWPMTQTQRVVDAITWHAGYDLGLHTARGKGLDGAEAEKLAIDIANQTVVDTQGSGRTGDMAAIMRGGEVSKFLTAFYTYFSTTYNLLNESVGRAIHKGEVAQMFGNVVALWALPAVLTDVIAGSLRGDSELLSAEKVARSEISYGLGMLVGFRELSGAVQGHGYSGPGSLGLINRAGQLIMQAQQGSVDAGLIKAASGVALSPFGLPAVEVGRLIDAWQAAAERGEYATALRTALFGKARSH